MPNENRKMRKKTENVKMCEFCGDEPLKRQAKRFCSRSCDGFARRGTTIKAKKHGRTQGKNYVRIRVDGVRVYLHRYIWEQMTGEILLDSDVIHHRDGNFYNNEFENLQKFASHEEHMAEHARMARIEAESRDDDEFSFWTNRTRGRSENTMERVYL